MNYLVLSVHRDVVCELSRALCVHRDVLCELSRALCPQGCGV